MNLLFFVVLSVLTMSLLIPIGNKYFVAIITIKDRKKYEILNFILIVLIGILVAKFIDFEKQPILSGICFGILESIIKVFIEHVED